MAKKNIRDYIHTILHMDRWNMKNKYAILFVNLRVHSETQAKGSISYSSYILPHNRNGLAGTAVNKDGKASLIYYRFLSLIQHLD